MAISNVELKNNYYEVFDGAGKKIKEIKASYVGELLGHGDDFIIFSDGNYFATYDESFRKIKETKASYIGNFKDAFGSTIHFVKDNYLGTYDKNFKMLIPERRI